MGSIIAVLKFSTPFETVILAAVPSQIKHTKPAHKDASVDLEGVADISENSNDTTGFLPSVLYLAFLIFEWRYFMTQFVQLPWE